jgi:hypothetical protein
LRILDAVDAIELFELVVFIAGLGAARKGELLLMEL